ncbi:universal stress protein [Haloplanus aerogenes]|uniref:Nucleotide-binding universal stress UspA family protein n=1 Tax=Haloplanus aerogenes TaxID=660522 RepID=A0A3M0DUK3_9EURY|nr:universal stress protein [Haloplanus aerogenes]AZH24713.1 universal stress protein [Haloplanus aerogenes]RMB23629.1 nucleotide-binding universal stress UspA family protein [Haloplanus aerogenes]
MELLVAVDGSEESDRALAYATDIANATDGSITLIHVIEPDVYDAGGGEPISPSDRRDRLVIDSLDAAEEQGRAIVDEAIEFASERGQTVSGELLYGQPAKVISEYAEKGEFETLYVGHRGRSERTIEFLGSVARDVVERTTVPVTVVK